MKENEMDGARGHVWGRGEKYIMYLAWTSGGNRARGRPTSRWEFSADLTILMVL